MQHWRSCKILLYLNVIVVMALSLALMGCPDDDGGGGNEVNINAEDFGLTDQNAAALAGLAFTFDAGLFDPDRAGETATLTFGENGDAFILTINGDTINGTITYGSCRFREVPRPEPPAERFDQTFDPCDAIVDAQDVPVGGCTAGQVQLTLGTVTSDATDTDVCIDDNGNITIGDNTVPVGTGATGGTGG